MILNMKNSMMIIFVFLGLTLSCNYQNKLTRNNKAGRYYKILRIESLDNIQYTHKKKIHYSKSFP